MILYFADRHFTILGLASTGLPNGLTVVDDLKTEDIETGVAVFECTIPFDKSTRTMVESYAEVGNYLLRSHNDENEFYTIIDAEIDTKNQQAYIYAEDAGMDLLNEIVGEYEADTAYTIDHYINKFAEHSGFQIGINEVSTMYRQLSFDDEVTATERIADIAAQFGGCEVSYSFDVEGLEVVKKYINIYKERGKDIGVTLRLNQDIDSIVTKKSISSLATALQCTGGTPDDAETPITLLGYQYDDGDFYVAGTVLKSRKALAKWDRFFWKNANNEQEGGHITRLFSSDALTQAQLCEDAIAELKQFRDMEVNYKVEIPKLPDNVKVGDRVNIVDDAGGLYLSTRILQLTTSVADQEQKATLGEYLIKGSGISQKVIDLAAQFAKSTVSVKRALNIASNAKLAAEEAQKQADAAVVDAEKAQTAADEAKEVANTATQSAAEATEAANNAQAAVDIVEESVSALETTVTNAQQAADNAQTAADTATAKAEEAKQAAQQAATDAADAKAGSEAAQSAADSAISKADTAQATASTAKDEAAAASATAAAAKADAEQAEKDVAALGDELETVTTTMSTEYARKTELTKTEAALQAQITQNAAEISSTVEMVQTIDETANNAANLASQAQSNATAAQQQADQATADARAAQTAADNAAQAAANAQSDADTAKAAATTAQEVADKAEADLEAAKTDLATVSSRVDATEEEITAAQTAVETAQAAADKAKADAATATTKATEAQTTANTAVENASAAQAAADDAASKAALAQKTADEAKGNAAAAQAKANEAAEAAEAAQQTANTAKTNAINAQATADAAAQAAANAQTAADDADAKAAQAASDLETARQNLAEVTSRVDATQEEVEAAQAAVVTAQAAADKAKEDAIAAQATADAAKADAVAAQTAADNAKTAADNAQKAADDAQDAADKAQADVDALAVRVTSAETKITQNSEKIELAATKTEVTETLGGYYTKKQTDAAITVKSNEITQTVSREYATKQEVKDIEIGGRNLYIVSSAVDGYLASDGSGVITAAGGITKEKTSGFIPVTPGDEMQFQVWVTTPSDSYVWYGYQFFNADQTPLDTNRPAAHIYEMAGGYYHAICMYAIIVPDGASYMRVSARMFEDGKIKVEKGNKATDWTPAPEDVADDIGSAQATANDALASISTAETTIQQLADSLSMIVRDGNSGSLITQDANGLYYFDISAIENSIAETAADLDGLSGIVLDANGKIDVLNSSVAALADRTEYIRSYTDENDQPCIELGEGDSNFTVKITNTAIQFAEGGNVPTQIETDGMRTENITVENELRQKHKDAQGYYVWAVRANGNYGLQWKGADE